jgi:hypothetical protein
MMPRPKGLPKTGGRQKGSVNKATADVKALAQEHGAEAIGRLVRIIKTSKNEVAVIAATREILDRGYGKAKQGVELSGADGGVFQVSISTETK